MNGSDPLWISQYNHYLNNTPLFPEAPGARHYRSTKDELKHSIRSVIRYINPKPRRLHLVLGDWEGDKEGGRIGQMPVWLNWDGRESKEVEGGLRIMKVGGTEVVVHHHSEIFWRGGAEDGEVGQRNFLKEGLPSFNSSVLSSIMVEFFWWEVLNQPNCFYAYQVRYRI